MFNKLQQAYSNSIPHSSFMVKPSNNLLVIFEETGGDPFQISMKLRSSETICGQVSEAHYPPMRKWSRPVSSSSRIALTDLTPEMHLKCENGHVISSVEFSSCGTPHGSCKNFKRSSCHAPNSLSVVTMVCGIPLIMTMGLMHLKLLCMTFKACQGKNSCSVGVSNAVFGGDPCHGIVKTLAVQARCAPLTTVFASVSK